MSAFFIFIFNSILAVQDMARLDVSLLVQDCDYFEYINGLRLSLMQSNGIEVDDSINQGLYE